MDYKLALMTGVDIPVEELKITLHQPTIKEISYIGEEGFFIAAQFLCLDKRLYLNGDKNLLDSISSFQVFSTILNDKTAVGIKDNIISLLTILLPNYRVMITPQSLVFVKDGETVLIDENNFDTFKTTVEQILCVRKSGGNNVVYNPANGRAQEIVDKIMRGRQKVAAEKGGNNKSVLRRYISILTVGLQTMSLEACLNLTLFQLYDLVERFTLHIAWDIDLRCRLQGGKPDKEPDDWMKDLD